MKIYRIAQVSRPTVIRHKDPVEQAKIDRRNDKEKIGQVLNYLRAISQAIRELETVFRIPTDSMSHVTDLYAAFKRLEQEAIFLSASAKIDIKKAETE